MTHPTQTQTKAQQLATYLESFFVSEDVSAYKAREIAAELRRLDAVERKYKESEYRIRVLFDERDQLRAQVEQAITMLQTGMPEFDASDVLDVLRNGAHGIGTDGGAES